MIISDIINNTMVSADLSLFLILIGIFIISCCQIVFRLLNNFLLSFPNIQYSTVQSRSGQFSRVQFSTAQYSAMQCSTVQYNTVEYSKAQYSTEQHGSDQQTLHVLWMSIFHTIGGTGDIPLLETLRRADKCSYLAASRSLCRYGITDVSMSVVSNTISLPFLPLVSGILGNLTPKEKWSGYIRLYGYQSMTAIQRL